MEPACRRAMRNQLIRPWVKGYKKHPILQAEFVYMDVESAQVTMLHAASSPRHDERHEPR